MFREFVWFCSGVWLLLMAFDYYCCRKCCDGCCRVFVRDVVACAEMCCHVGVEDFVDGCVVVVVVCY